MGNYSVNSLQSSVKKALGLFWQNVGNTPQIMCTGLPHVREKSGKIVFFQGQGIVREFEIMSRKFWKGANVKEKSGNFMLGFWKICYIIIFIHKNNLFSKCKLNLWTSWLITWFPVVLVSCKSHQIWHNGIPDLKNSSSIIILPQNPRKVQGY